jgi:hypothetical protein
MPTQDTNEATRSEWRELSFFYDRDDVAKEWRIVGSVKGLQKFSAAMRDYASNPANDSLSEHEHFGP